MHYNVKAEDVKGIEFEAFLNTTKTGGLKVIIAPNKVQYRVQHQPLCGGYNALYVQISEKKSGQWGQHYVHIGPHQDSTDDY